MTVHEKKMTEELDRAVDRLFIESTESAERHSVDDLRRRRLIDSALEAGSPQAVTAAPQVEGRKRRLRALRIGAIAAGLAAIFIFGWFIRNPGETSIASLPESPLRDATNGDVIASVVEPTRSDRRADPLGRVNMQFSPGIRAVTTEETRFTVDRTQDDAVSVRLDAGVVWVSKNPKDKKTRLEIETPIGTVTVTGTVFSVRADDRSLEVTVLRGTVRVTETSGSMHSVTAGSVWSLRSGRVFKGPIDRPAETRKQFRTLGILDDDTLPAEIVAGTPDLRSDIRPRNGKPRARPVVSDTINPRVALETLLSEIAAQRRQQDWTAAATGYQQLIQEHGGTAEARSAMVALGTLLDDRLSRPEEALRWFDAYLHSNARTLAPEAMLGKARCLRRLRRHDAERAVLKELALRYPDSIYAKQATDRLRDLSEQ